MSVSVMSICPLINRYRDFSRYRSRSSLPRVEAWIGEEELMTFSQLIRRLLSDERGATVIEYSLIAALIGMAIITPLKSVNVSLTSSYSKTANALDR
jgi:pilus assembly protein Flp/PilA